MTWEAGMTWAGMTRAVRPVGMNRVDGPLHARQPARRFPGYEGHERTRFSTMGATIEKGSL